MHPAPKTLWWSNHRSVRGYAEQGCVIAHLSPITRRAFVKCGDPVALLQTRRRAANAVTRRSHPRIFVRAVDKKGQPARGRPQADVRVSNCVVGSGGSWLPCSTIAEHSVEGCDHFSHDGDDDDLGFF